MSSKGFTIIELLIGLAVVAIVAGVVLSSLLEFRRHAALNEAAENALSLLREARSRTLASESASAYGVRFDPSGLTLFRGSYSAGDPGNETYALPSLVTATTSLAGGASEVVFERLTGEAAAHGEATVSLLADPGRNRTIIIRPTGTAGLE